MGWLPYVSTPIPKKTKEKKPGHFLPLNSGGEKMYSKKRSDGFFWGGGVRGVLLLFHDRELGWFEAGKAGFC
jgi:hypothetical protein